MGVSAVVQEITDRKRREAEQQIALRDLNLSQAALEQRNQDLDSFIYIVAHDLKAPLRAVANLSKWIEDDLQGSLCVANQ